MVILALMAVALIFVLFVDVKVKKDTSKIDSKMNEKSKRMVSEGPVCPPHNWDWKKVINEYGHQVDVHFCDICKRTSKQLNSE